MRKRTSKETVAKRRLNRRKWKAADSLTKEDQMRLLTGKFASRISVGGKITRVPLS